MRTEFKRVECWSPSPLSSADILWPGFGFVSGSGVSIHRKRIVIALLILYMQSFPASARILWHVEPAGWLFDD